MSISAIEYAGNRALVTPGTNTNPPFEVKVDTLTLICRKVYSGIGRSDIIRLTECTFGETIEFDETRGTHSGKYWRGSTIRSLKGTRILWNPGIEDPDTPGEVSVHLTGTGLEGISLFELVDYLDVLQDYGLDITEIHVALDDLDKTVPLSLVGAAVRDGNITGARNGLYIEGLGEDKKGHDTINIGSVQSDKRLTVYAKDKESSDDYYGNRWEAKFRRKYANEVFSHMLECETPEALTAYMAGIVLGCIKFVDKSSGDHHVDRLPSLPWYEKLCLSVAPAVRVSPPKKKVTLRDSIGWVEKQVLRRLGMIKKAMGKEFSKWLSDGISEKVSYLSPVDEAMIEEYQQHEQQQQQEKEQQKREQQQQQATERAATLRLRPNHDEARASRISAELSNREKVDETARKILRSLTPDDISSLEMPYAHVKSLTKRHFL